MILVILRKGIGFEESEVDEAGVLGSIDFGYNEIKGLLDLIDEFQKIKDELFVHSVTSQEVVFEFRGVLIKRRVPLQIPGTWER